MPPPKPDQENQDSEEDSDDDDFAPEITSQPPKKRGAKADSSDDEDSDAQSEANVNGEDAIDADEAAAMKREREQMITEAGGEHRLGKRRRGAAVDTDTVNAQTK